MHVADPVFPPLLTGHAVKAPLLPFEEACRRVAAAELGAGDVVWSRNTAVADLAIVLEPEVGLRRALQIGPLFTTALTDSLGALLPPQSAVLLRWPDTVLLNGGVVGKVHMATAPAAPDEVPDWLVIGARIELRNEGSGEPGETAHLTTFAEEGAGDLTRSEILQSMAAHFLAWLNIWQDDGFRPVHNHWIARVEGYGESVPIQHGAELIHGRVLGLDDDMNLLVKPDAGPPRALPLIDLIGSARRAPAS